MWNDRESCFYRKENNLFAIEPFRPLPRKRVGAWLIAKTARAWIANRSKRIVVCFCLLLFFLNFFYPKKSEQLFLPRVNLERKWSKIREGLWLTIALYFPVFVDGVHVILVTRHISSSIDLIIYYLVAINRRSAKVWFVSVAYYSR